MMSIASEIEKSTRILEDLRGMFYRLREIEKDWSKDAFNVIADRAREEIRKIELLQYDNGTGHSFLANEVSKN